jgi:membrane protein implicated in regulation of membrane protease activity
MKILLLSHKEYKITFMEMLLENLNYLHWLVFGLALVIVELFLWSMFLLWIGASAITISIVFYLYPEVSAGLQVLSFVLLSAVSTFLAKKYFPVKTVDDVLNLNAKDHIGKECTVVSIENSIVKVRMGESLWFAKGCEMSVGQKVQIVDVESSTFIVEPSNKD